MQKYPLEWNTASALFVSAPSTPLLRLIGHGRTFRKSLETMPESAKGGCLDGAVQRGGGENVRVLGIELGHHHLAPQPVSIESESKNFAKDTFELTRLHCAIKSESIATTSAGAFFTLKNLLHPSSIACFCRGLRGPSSRSAHALRTSLC